MSLCAVHHFRAKKEVGSNISIDCRKIYMSKKRITFTLYAFERICHTFSAAILLLKKFTQL